MQKVSQLPYQRVSMEEFAQEIQGIITQVKEASSAQAVMAARDQCNQLVIRWQTAEALSYMRYSINTADPFYLAEKDYYDEVGPQAQNYLLEYTKAMLATPFRQELEESGAIIPLVFRSFEVELKSISPEIIEDMVEENPADGGDGVRVPRGEAAPSHADEIRQVPGPGHAEGGL